MIDPFLTDLIQDTRALAMRYWREGFAIETKPDRSLVTEADKAVEALIRDRIAKAFPGDGIYGEEYGAEGLEAERVWVIDPIDGTQAFVMGIPVFSTLIALMEEGKVVQAVADFPAMDLTFSARRGAGAWMNRERLQTSTCQELTAAALTATSTTMFTQETDPNGKFACVVAATNSVRYGLDAYGFCSLARGRADLGVEACLQPYDYLAPSLIVSEAGGLMTDWAGKPLSLESDGRVLAAATPALHNQALEVLAA